MRFAGLVGLAATAVTLCPAGAQPQAPEARLRSALDSVRLEQGFPGAQIVVVKDGRIALDVALGVTDLERGEPVTPRTGFPVGSITKPFTATLAMKRVRDGRLSLDDSIGAWLPALPEHVRGIRIRHLLSHTSGLPRDIKRGHSLYGDELMAALADMPADFDAGTSWAYSNTGFIVLGAVLEAESGRPLEDLLRDEIFRPLAMTNTVVRTPSATVERATGYEGTAAQPSRLAFLPSRYGAGNIVSTAGDLARWVIGLDAGTLLDPQTQRVTWDPSSVGGPYPDIGEYLGKPTRLGYGWFVASDGGRRVVGHGGSVDGFVGTVERYVDEGVAIIVLTNFERGDVRAFFPLLEAAYLDR